MNFVIDTWVLYRAKDNDRRAIEFVYSFKRGNKVFVDKEGKILTEYKSVPGSLISQWLRIVLTKRIVKIKIKKRCKNIVECKKDMKFVYVCLNSSKVNIIVSGDHHFSNNSDLLLQKGITLLDIDQALLVS